MSRLFVGQRVRVVRNVGWQDPVLNSLIGREGRICAINKADCSFSGDHPIELHEFGDVLFHPDDLEPILPDGHRPAEQDIHELLPFLRERVDA